MHIHAYIALHSPCVHIEQQTAMVFLIRVPHTGAGMRHRSAEVLCVVQIHPFFTHRIYSHGLSHSCATHRRRTVRCAYSPLLHTPHLQHTHTHTNTHTGAGMCHRSAVALCVPTLTSHTALTENLLTRAPHTGEGLRHHSAGVRGGWRLAALHV